MLKDGTEDKQVGVWNSSGYGTLGELVLKDSSDKKIIWLVDKNDPYDFY